jgi:hypothetical protein
MATSVLSSWSITSPLIGSKHLRLRLFEGSKDRVSSEKHLCKIKLSAGIHTLPLWPRGYFAAGAALFELDWFIREDALHEQKLVATKLRAVSITTVVRNSSHLEIEQFLCHGSARHISIIGVGINKLKSIGKTR